MKFEAFSKFTRLFEDIFNGIEAFSSNLGLKLFPDKWRFLH
jgi:hypothetical protein